MGYSAQTAGMVLSAAAALLLIALPLVGQLTGKIQAMSFASATWLRIAQYVPILFIFIPATLAAYLGIPREKSNAVAGWVNFVRNMGSSVGTSAVTTILARRAQVHQVMLASNTHLGNTPFQGAAASLTDRLNRGAVASLNYKLTVDCMKACKLKPKRYRTSMRSGFWG